MTKVEHKFNKGDKFVIEIAEVHTHYTDNGVEYPLYRIKGFGSMVMTEFALNKLVLHQDEVEKFCKNCTQFETVYDRENNRKVCDMCKKYKCTVGIFGHCEFFKMAKRCKE